MREIMCSDDGCTLEAPKNNQVGGGTTGENVSYLTPGSSGLNPEAGSWLIPLSSAKRTTSKRGGQRRKRRQVGGGRKRQVGGRKHQVGGRKKRGRKARKPIKVKRLQTGGRKRLQTGGRKRLSVKRRRRCVK